MPKTLTRLTLALLTAALCARAAAAQTAREWIVLSPAGEGFTALAPRQPVSTPQRVQANGLNASGHRYALAADEETTFVVWSMKGSYAHGQLGGGDRAIKTSYSVAPFLDTVGELAWELLITPELERLEQKGVTGTRLAELRVGMAYAREFELSGLPAREYAVRLERERGHVYVCSDGAQVYVVAALGAEGDASLRRFVDSFALRSDKSPAPAGGGAPLRQIDIGPGSGPDIGSTVPPPAPD